MGGGDGGSKCVRACVVLCRDCVCACVCVGGRAVGGGGREGCEGGPIKGSHPRRSRGAGERGTAMARSGGKLWKAGVCGLHAQQPDCDSLARELESERAGLAAASCSFPSPRLLGPCGTPPIRCAMLRDQLSGENR